MAWRHDPDTDTLICDKCGNRIDRRKALPRGPSGPVDDAEPKPCYACEVAEQKAAG